MSRAICAAALVLVAALAAPAAASAHAGDLNPRQNLPLPEIFFAWTAAVVLVVSFAALALLWPTSRLEKPPWRPLPFGFGRLLASRAVEVLCGAIGVALLVLTIVAGYIGPDSEIDNLAPTFLMIVVWVGLMFVSVLFGDVFRAFNPWRAIGRATGRLLGPRAGTRRPYPEWLGRWPAALGLFAFTWIELVSGWVADPPLLVTAVVGYTVLTLAGQAVWGTETWTRRGEFLSVYFNLFARISPFETRDGVAGVRPPLGGLPRLDQAPGTVTFVVLMIGTVTFDGLSQGPLWNDIAPGIQDAFSSLGFGEGGAERLAGTVGLLLGVAVVAALYGLGMEGTRSVGGGFTAARLRQMFAHSLVPIAAVYVAAHYLTYTLFGGQRMKYLVSDPLGQGWDLFGSADAGIDFSLLSDNAVWYTWVTFVVIGHVAGLMLAHDRALAVYREARPAVRSQYWMLAIMVGFTMLAIWLLAMTGRT